MKGDLFRKRLSKHRLKGLVDMLGYERTAVFIVGYDEGYSAGWRKAKGRPDKKSALSGDSTPLMASAVDRREPGVTIKEAIRRFLDAQRAGAEVLNAFEIMHKKGGSGENVPLEEAVDRAKALPGGRVELAEAMKRYDAVAPTPKKAENAYFRLKAPDKERPRQKAGLTAKNEGPSNAV